MDVKYCGQYLKYWLGMRIFTASLYGHGMYRVIIALIVLILFGCANVSPISKVELGEKLQNSKRNSAISWYYLGENEKSYFISENAPMKEKVYEIPKSLIQLVDIKHFRYNSINQPLNLKFNNFKFE
jgi:hypothetical protein